MITDVSFRAMTEGDLLPANRLREIAGWNQALEDWRLLLALEPNGCFVGTRNEEVIATVTTTTYSRALAWVGMMLVHPRHRQQGIATLLMRMAVDYLEGRRVACIKLDATPAGRPVYERLGFTGGGSMTRHAGPSTSPRASPRPATTRVREMNEIDWPAIRELDARGFGVAREPVLRGLANRARQALVVELHGAVVGWGLLRSGAISDYLGPIACRSAEVLLPLVESLLTSAKSHTVLWDVPDDHEAAVSTAHRLGFRPIRSFLRMCRGTDSTARDPRLQPAVADPALG